MIGPNRYKPRGSHEAAVMAAVRRGPTTIEALRDECPARRWPARSCTIDRLTDNGVLAREGNVVRLAEGQA